LWYFFEEMSVRISRNLLPSYTGTEFVTCHCDMASTLRAAFLSETVQLAPQIRPKESSCENLNSVFPAELYRGAAGGDYVNT
jgi:hypothetical protein